MRIVFLCLLLLVIAILTYQNQQHHTQLNPVSTRFLHPFDDRIRYKITEVDPRFGLSHDDLLEITQQAANIWTEATGKSYFVYDPNARLSIRLIYDERQYQTEQRKKEIAKIDQHQNKWNQQKNHVDVLSKDMDEQYRLLNFKKAELSQLVIQHNESINQINRLGGADPQQRQILETQSQELEHRMQQMQTEINTYNFNIEILNRKVDDLNQLNRNIDQSVNQFNQKFRPRLFDKGIFNGREIHVYEFSNIDDLRLTLAHEFGHALGLGHHNEPNALMFPMLKEQDLQHFRLHPADLALLAER
jgi:hypothetical protein